MHLRVSLLAVAGAAAVLLGSHVAQANSCSIQQGSLADPARLVKGALLVPGSTPSPLRPLNLTPLGINFADCAAGTVLRFQPSLAGSSTGLCDATDDIQVWASNLGAQACLTSAARASSSCWLVYRTVRGSAPDTQPDATGASSSNVPTWDLPVWDVVGPQDGVVPAAGTVASEDISACFSQPSASEVQFSILFLPVLTGTSTYDTASQAYEYELPTDLVGPPTPVWNSTVPQSDDSGLTLSWLPNTDSDTYGYDVFIDPPPSGIAASTVGLPVPSASTCIGASSGASSGSSSGSSGASGASSGAASGAGEEEVDAATDDVESVDASTTDAASGDADGSTTDAASAIDATVLDAATTSDASASTSTDAECVAVTASAFWNAGNQQSTCTSTNLTQAYVLAATPSSASSGSASGDTASSGDTSGASSGASAGSAGSSSGDSSGASGDFTSGAVASSGSSGSSSGTAGGGLAGIACAYLVGGSCAAASAPAYTSQALTVADVTSSSYTVTGLTNGKTYSVTVSAVDAFGNPGPPAAEECSYPAPISDFYHAYRDAGGTAGGGYCTFAPAGSSSRFSLAAGAGAAIAFGVRRRRQKRSTP